MKKSKNSKKKQHNILPDSKKSYGVPADPNGKYKHGCHPNSLANLNPPEKGNDGLNQDAIRGFVTLTAALRRIVHRRHVSGKTVGEFLCEVATDQAAKGNFAFYKEIFDRLDGKIPEQLVISNMQRSMVQQAALIADGVVAAVQTVIPLYVEKVKVPEILEEIRKEIKKELKKVPNLFEFESMNEAAAEPKTVEGDIVEEAKQDDNHDTDKAGERSEPQGPLGGEGPESQGTAPGGEVVVPVP